MYLHIIGITSSHSLVSIISKLLGWMEGANLCKFRERPFILKLSDFMFEIHSCGGSGWR